MKRNAEKLKKRKAERRGEKAETRKCGNAERGDMNFLKRKRGSIEKVLGIVKIYLLSIISSNF